MKFGIDLNEQGRMLGAHLLNRTIVRGPQTKERAISVGYPESRLRMVLHGIYTQFPLGNHTITPGQVLVFGNIRENKGYDRLPEILHLVAEQCLGISAIVAGEVPHTADETWAEETLTELRAHSHITVDQRYIPMEKVQNTLANLNRCYCRTIMQAPAVCS